MSEGAISCFVYGARTLACSAFSPTDLMPATLSQHIAGKPAHCSAPWGWRKATLITPHNPSELTRSATDTEHSDGIVFAGAYRFPGCVNFLASAGPNALNPEHPHGSPVSDNECWYDSPTR
jgi:hypothetical protein